MGPKLVVACDPTARSSLLCLSIQQRPAYQRFGTRSKWDGPSESLRVCACVPERVWVLVVANDCLSA